MLILSRKRIRINSLRRIVRILGKTYLSEGIGKHKWAKMTLDFGKQNLDEDCRT